MCAIVQDWLYRLCACILSLLYSIATRSVNGQSTRVTPMSHSLEKVFTDGQLQDVNLG